MLFAAKGVDNLCRLTLVMPFVSKCWPNGFFECSCKCLGIWYLIFLREGELIKLTSMYLALCSGVVSLQL